MEYAKGGELFKYIVNKKRLDESEASYFYSQLISGLEIIHKNGVVHRDIKPENLLLKENNILTLIDFGLSNTYKKGQLLNSACGSQCYEAPEMLLGQNYHGLSVDIWSSGIVLYAMVCGYLPFEDRDSKVLCQKIIEAKFDIPRHIGHDCKDLIQKILVTDPRNRISLDSIKKHPFLKKAFNLYKVEEHIAEKNNICEPVIEFMTHSKSKGIGGWKRDEIISHLKHNSHNEITTSYYLLFNKYKFNNNLFHQYTSSNSTKGTSQISFTNDSRFSSNLGGTSDSLMNSSNSINKGTSSIPQPHISPSINNYGNDYSDIKSVNNYNMNINYYYIDDSISVGGGKCFNKNIRPGSSISKQKTISSKKSGSSSRGYSGTNRKSNSKARNNSKNIYKPNKPNDVVISLNVTKLLSKNTKPDFIDIGTPKVLIGNRKLATSSAKSKSKGSSQGKTTYDSHKGMNPFLEKKHGIVHKSTKIRYVPSNTINLDEDLPESPNKAVKISKKSSNKSLNSITSKRLSHFLSYTIKSNSDFKLSKYIERSRSQLDIINIKIKNELFRDSESDSSFQTNNFDAKSTCTIPRTYKKSHFVIPLDRNMKNPDGQSMGGTSPGRAKRNKQPKHPTNSNYNSNEEGFNIYSTMVDDNISKGGKSKKIEISCASGTSRKTNPKTKLKSSNTTTFAAKKSPGNKGKPTPKGSMAQKGIISQGHYGLKSNLNNNAKQKSKQNANNNVIDLSENTKGESGSGTEDYVPSFTEENTNKCLHTHKSNASNKSNNTTLGFSVKNKPLIKKNDVSVAIKNPQPDVLAHKTSKNLLTNKKSSINKKAAIKKTGTTVIGIDIAEQSDTASVNSDYSVGSQRSVRVKKSIGLSGIVKNKSKNQKSTTNQKGKKHGNNIVDVIDLSKDEDEVKPKAAPIPTVNAAQFDLVEDLETKAKIINNAKDLAVCPVSGTTDEIYTKLNTFCKEHSLTLINLGKRFICKKDSDNSISIEISGSGDNNVLKLYHLNGQESITKEIIKKIIMTLGFE